MIRTQRYMLDELKKRPAQVQCYVCYESFFHLLGVLFFSAIMAIMCKFTFTRNILLKVSFNVEPFKKNIHFLFPFTVSQAVYLRFRQSRRTYRRERRAHPFQFRLGRSGMGGRSTRTDRSILLATGEDGHRQSFR